MSDETEEAKFATVVWEGDSKEILKVFPEEVTQNLGFELWQLQQGERPRNYRPLPSVGQGVLNCGTRMKERGIALFTCRG